MTQSISRTRSRLTGLVALVALLAMLVGIAPRPALADRGSTTAVLLGRVVYPNGDVLYTGNGNGQPCTYDGYGTPCADNPSVYYPRDYNGGRHDRDNEYEHHHRHDGGHHEHDHEDGEHGQHEHDD